ncbi:hypothetical protein BJY00DRAFT_312769 [Aspergillus carlsbadensis]|nr:hypothetical protein BJY00DRAFT_312769 [Aspergillus carlsbadensis]
MDDPLLSDATTLGWALRQYGSCLAHEEDCGETANPYRACCPGGSYCPRAYNIACCPSSLNCTDALQARPACANATWDLYYNGGYFCCERGTRGYATSFESNGCGEPEYELADSETLLSMIVAGTKTYSSSSSTNSGAIAGGVLGGVAGLAIIVAVIWFIVRMRRRNHQEFEMTTPIREITKKEYPPTLRLQSPATDGGAYRTEVVGGVYQGVAELPGHDGR